MAPFEALTVQIQSSQTLFLIAHYFRHIVWQEQSHTAATDD